MAEINPQIQSLVRTSRIIFFGILAQATLFAFWGLSFFMTQEPLKPPSVAVYLLFAFMGGISFIYGIRFFQNYTRVKEADLLKKEPRQRREALLVAVAIHLLLLEFVCILGILLAVFVQKKEIIYPFYLLFAAGLYFSYPKADWYRRFYKESNG